jgi:hypothetical protein
VRPGRSELITTHVDPDRQTLLTHRRTDFTQQQPGPAPGLKHPLTRSNRQRLQHSQASGNQIPTGRQALLDYRQLAHKLHISP